MMQDGFNYNNDTLERNMLNGRSKSPSNQGIEATKLGTIRIRQPDAEPLVKGESRKLLLALAQNAATSR